MSLAPLYSNGVTCASRKPGRVIGTFRCGLAGDGVSCEVGWSVATDRVDRRRTCNAIPRVRLRSDPSKGIANMPKEPTYRDILEFIENNGVSDASGGYKLRDTDKIGYMVACLMPMREGPSQIETGDTLRPVVPAVATWLAETSEGTPEYHADLCWQESKHVHGKHRYFPAESMRHLRRAVELSDGPSALEVGDDLTALDETSIDILNFLSITRMRRFTRAIIADKIVECPVNKVPKYSEKTIQVRVSRLLSSGYVQEPTLRLGVTITPKGLQALGLTA